MGNRKRILAAASVAFWAACGGGQTYNLTGSGTVTGTFNGVSLNAGDAVSNLVSQSGGSAGAILITTSTAQCNLINNHQALKNGQALALELGTQSGNTVSAPTLGTHTVFTSGGIVGQNGKVGIAQYVATNASCSGNVLEAVSGTITLTRVEATGYGGTFDLTFPQPSPATGTDHITGSFNTGTCSALGTSQTSCPP